MRLHALSSSTVAATVSINRQTRNGIVPAWRAQPVRIGDRDWEHIQAKRHPPGLQSGHIVAPERVKLMQLMQTWADMVDELKGLAVANRQPPEQRHFDLCPRCYA